MTGLSGEALFAFAAMVGLLDFDVTVGGCSFSKRFARSADRWQHRVLWQFNGGQRFAKIFRFGITKNHRRISDGDWNWWGSEVQRTAWHELNGQRTEGGPLVGDLG